MKTPGTDVRQETTSEMKVAADQAAPKSLAVLEKGIKTSHDFAATMSALMTDVITGAVTPQIANAVCNAGGKLLKVVEMQHRWGRRSGGRDDGDQVLNLTN